MSYNIVSNVNIRAIVPICNEVVLPVSWQFDGVCTRIKVFYYLHIIIHQGKQGSFSFYPTPLEIPQDIAFFAFLNGFHFPDWPNGICQVVPLGGGSPSPMPAETLNQPCVLAMHKTSCCIVIKTVILEPSDDI